jgi:hypothetical protein
MLEIKFTDYEYYEDAIVTGVSVSNGEVSITLDPEDGSEFTAELVKGDFLKLFGQEVTALYNEKEDEFLSIAPTGKSNVVSGSTYDLNDDKYIFGVAEDAELVYGSDVKESAMLVLGNKKTSDYTTYFSGKDSFVVEKVRANDGDVRVNGTLMNEDAIVLKDGKWLTVEDIEVGDVVTELIDNELFIVTTTQVEGSFEKMTTKADGTRLFVDGKDYFMVPEGSKHYLDGKDNGELTTTEAKNLEDENVVLTLNYLGEVVRIDTGKVPATADDGDFYAVESAGVWKVGNADGEIAYIKLQGLEEETFVIEDGYEYPTLHKGDFVYVELNDDGEIDLIANVSEDNNPYGSDDNLTVDMSAVVGSDADEGKLAGKRVTDNTVVYTVLTETEDGKTTVTVSASTGVSEIKDLEAANTVDLVYDEFGKVQYVRVETDETIASEDLLFGIVKEMYTTNNEPTMDVEDMDGNLIEGIVISSGTTAEGNVIAYKLNSDDEAIIKTNLTKADVTNGGTLVVDEVSDDGRTAIIHGGAIVDLDEEELTVAGNTYKLDNYRYFLVDVDLDENDDPEFTGMEEVDLEDTTFEENDRISADETNKLIVIMRGYEEIAR